MIDFSDHSEAIKPLRFFEEITKIPRGSGNTAGIADYLVSFAEKRGLSYIRDSVDNIIISKPATAGYEGKAGIVFQGHTDIVAEKLPEVDIDMTKEGPRMYRDGDLLRAKGTTLGADDGVAVAYALAVLDADDIPHPDFEAVFTVDEEVGLTGAKMLSPSAVKGRMLINIDSDAEGTMTVGCAGGVRADVVLPVTREEAEGKCYRLSVSGLRGGHSGVDIDKGRVNALRLLGEMLNVLPRIRLITLEGGNADNAIPRDASATFIATAEIGSSERGALNRIMRNSCAEEKDATFTLTEEKAEGAALCPISSGRIASLLSVMPNGVLRMSEDIEGLVETSLNMGVARLAEGSFTLSFAIRSSKGAEKAKAADRVRQVAEGHGATCSLRSDYPAWEYRPDSRLRDVMKKGYCDLYGKEPEILIIHAGLECGILSETLTELDAVSIGPNAYAIHSPDEALSISSFARTWEYLKAILKNL